MKRRKKGEKALNGVVYFLLILVLMITIIPIGWVLSTSVKTTTEVFANPPRWIPNVLTIENYKTVFLDSAIPRAFLNSVIVGLLTSLIALLLGGSSGYAFARFQFRGSKFLSLFMLIDTKIGLAIAHLVISLPLVTWMAKGYFKGIPKEIEEAATVDGCSTMQTLTKIVLPLLKPALVATGIYAFISSWNEYALANVLTRSEQSRTVPIALNEFSSFFKVDWGSTMAAAMIITVPVIIAFMFVQKQFVEGLAAGAVKG